MVEKQIRSCAFAYRHDGQHEAADDREEQRRDAEDEENQERVAEAGVSHEGASLVLSQRTGPAPRR